MAMASYDVVDFGTTKYGEHAKKYILKGAGGVVLEVSDYGGKVTDVYGYRYTKSGKESKVKVTKKMLKNGTSISFPKKYEKMSVCVYMENGKSSIYYDVFFNRPQS